MPLLRGELLILGILIAPAAISVASQDGGTGNAAGTTHVAQGYKPSNLKVLPKDISTVELNTVMYQYQRSLGQPCTFCHAENSETKQIEFASDENPMKNTARMMIKMTTDLNTKYLAELGDRRYAAPFTCGNCHRGQIQPPPFE